jgi:uncharacterized protein
MSNQYSSALKLDAPPELSVRQIVDEASRLLPIQAPIHAFVHQNILTAFEHLPFEAAMKEASRVFGSNAFPSEAFFTSYLANGRIQEADIDAVLNTRTDIGADPIWPGGPSRHTFQSGRVHHAFDIPQGPMVAWMVEETSLLETFCEGIAAERLGVLKNEIRQAATRFGSEPGNNEFRFRHAFLTSLWSNLSNCAPTGPRHLPPHRRRDQILEDSGVDTDEWVHPLMIRITGAFLDQGISYWPMPERGLGILRATRKLYGASLAPPDRHFIGLAALLREQEQATLGAEATIVWALDALGHDDQSRWPAVLQATLLALPGWGGMINQLERSPEKSPVKELPSRLMDFLALRLVLDVVAARNVSGGRGDRAFRFESIATEVRPYEVKKNLATVYEAFILAQRMDVDATALLDASKAQAWMDEVIRFDSSSRSELLMLAFEHRYRTGVLDALMASATAPRIAPTPSIQMVFCIDDREESYRRHIEEVDPSVETFSYPGFFGVAMNFQGETDIRPRALCPVVMKPTHAVHEVAPATSPSVTGRLAHQYHVGRSTLLRGAFFSLLGVIATIPLVLIVLFPRLASYRKPKKRLTDPPLKFRHETAAPVRADGLAQGYKPAEMADVVGKMLIETGLRHHMTPLVLLIGHGSTSVNNPHIAGYGCGATAGGSGGANARVISAMANDPETRAILADRGIQVPAETWFVGGQHNTCTDDVAFYDEDKVPQSLHGSLREAARVLALASREHAHERCRLFATVPDGIEPSGAKMVVEERSVDLSEARPEYDHSKNSICIVGRRKWTRGIFLDKRSFLVSYDGTLDHDGLHLVDTLTASVPVCAGINLSYLMSMTDNIHYGSGTKLPHNITGLLGVMDGHASDLRPGLYHQMIEIHEPLRLLLIVETTPAAFLAAMAKRPVIDRLIRNRWIHACAWSPDEGKMFVFEDNAFRAYVPEHNTLAVAKHSRELYRGTRAPLPCVRIEAAFDRTPS